MDEFADKRILIEFPVYVVLAVERHGGAKGRLVSPGVVVIGDTSDTKYMTTFSDEELAKRFCREHGLLDGKFRIARFNDPRKYLQYLESQYRSGLRRVALDPQSGREATAFDMQNLLRNLRRLV